MSEGDAQRYFDHAVTLYRTLRFLRGERAEDDDALDDAQRLSPGAAIGRWSASGRARADAHAGRSAA